MFYFTDAFTREDFLNRGPTNLEVNELIGFEGFINSKFQLGS